MEGRLMREGSRSAQGGRQAGNRLPAPACPRARRGIGFIWPILLTAVLGLFPLVAGAQQNSSHESPCGLTTISIPSRPTVASATDTTECGVIEAEYGFERQWPVSGGDRDDLTGGLRFGITPRLDLHWASSDYLSLYENGSTHEGFGDSWLGLKYRIAGQNRVRPALGLFYQAKIPSASERAGLGWGQVDHSLAVLLSKDIHPLHFDFNVIPTLVGREQGGYDHSVGLALATWMPLNRKWNLVVEPYGYTAVNQSSPGYASLMGGVNYQIRPQFFLDAGADAGLTNAAPHRRLYAGATYALGNLYTWFRPQTQR